jgi:hypothetical protein
VTHPCQTTRGDTYDSGRPRPPNDVEHRGHHGHERAILCVFTLVVIIEDETFLARTYPTLQLDMVHIIQWTSAARHGLWWPFLHSSGSITPGPTFGSVFSQIQASRFNGTAIRTKRTISFNRARIVWVLEHDLEMFMSPRPTQGSTLTMDVSSVFVRSDLRMCLHRCPM